MSIYGWSMDGTVTVASMHTLPTTCQTIHGCHRYCAIHGTSIDGHLACHLLSKYPWMPAFCAIHGWTPSLPPSVKVSIHGHINCTIHGYLERGGRAAKVSIYGWSMDGTVTVASMDILTEGGREGVHHTTLEELLCKMQKKLGTSFPGKVWKF